jgi:hypothetical protein
MTERVNAKLYKLQEVLVKKNSDPTKLIETIIDTYNEKSGNLFIEKKLRIDLNQENYNSKLFVFKTPQKPPIWYDFLSSIVQVIIPD